MQMSRMNSPLDQETESDMMLGDDESDTVTESDEVEERRPRRRRRKRRRPVREESPAETVESPATARGTVRTMKRRKTTTSIWTVKRTTMFRLTLSRPKHRKIPTWDEAMDHIISLNLAARVEEPRGRIARARTQVRVRWRIAYSSRSARWYIVAERVARFGRDGATLRQQ